MVKSFKEKENEERRKEIGKSFVLKFGYGFYAFVGRKKVWMYAERESYQNAYKAVLDGETMLFLKSSSGKYELLVRYSSNFLQWVIDRVRRI
jgi:predicted nuclease of restriction endonuclease-like (RecB) superfamily